MRVFLEAIGGRKHFLLLVAIILVSLKNALGMDQDQIDMILQISLYGAGIIAAQDVAGIVMKKNEKPGVNPPGK